jgi:hypothetical protein
VRGVHGLSGVLLHFVLPPRRRVLAGGWMRVTHGDLDPAHISFPSSPSDICPLLNRRNVMRQQSSLRGLSGELRSVLSIL